MLKTFTLSNGVKVATYAMPTVKSLHIGMSVKGGSMVENAAHNGIAHYMEHMMVQGIPSFPNAELLSNYIESLAGRYNASTSPLLVHFSITVPFSHLEDAIKITSEVFFQPTFPMDAMEKERQAVFNELKQHLDSRWYKFNQYFRKTRYKETSILQRETIGKEQLIKKLTKDDLVSYWKSYFSPENMYLFIGGNFKEKELLDFLETYMAKHPSSGAFSGYPSLSRADLREKFVGIRHDDTLQVNYITFSFPSVEFNASLDLLIKESIALDILGRFRSSRLFKLLRYQKGYVYGVSANDVRWPGVGFSVIDSEVATEHLDEVISLTTQTLREYVSNGPTDAELGFAKHYLTNQWLMAFDSPGSIGDWVEGGLLWRETVSMPEDYIKIIEAVTVEDVQEVMKKYWDMQKLQLIIQGPISDSAENIKKYKAMIASLYS